jgi:hypothetical protein
MRNKIDELNTSALNQQEKLAEAARMMDEKRGELEKALPKLREMLTNMQDSAVPLQRKNATVNGDAITVSRSNGGRVTFTFSSEEDAIKYYESL